MDNSQPNAGGGHTAAHATAATDQVNPSGPDMDIRGLVGKSIAELRKLLLDLTLKNRLLKYNPDDTRADHIRLVDEVPSQLIKKLKKGDVLTFAPVPLPEAEPEDERTAEFQAALLKYKESDPDYLEERDKLGVRPKKKAVHQLERKVRDAMRKRLDMAPWKTVSSARAHAQTLGIPTTYDLPRHIVKDSHDDEFLQTLFFAEQMDAKLEAIHTTADTLEKDAGVQALYAGFGFLEWQPNKDSSEIIQSPLLLLPLQMDRTLKKQVYEYSIMGQDDDEALNESLFEKLKEDFGIALPRIEDYADEESGEIDLYGWYDAIEKAITDIQPTWRVNNWVVIGIMTFHRISLWNDLNPDSWPGVQNPLDNQTMTEIFGGTGLPWNENTGGEYDIDTSEASEKPCLLITDADSSQHGAIIDAMSGQNMVIEGPPGTGKSQTITNIIAAALDAGKTVLFVAEKIAALEVVKKRLDGHGLGHFCLELHSDKANRASVIKSIKSRKEMDLPYHDNAAMQSAKRGLIGSKEKLTHYARRMNEPAGDTGKTVHEIFWGHIANKHHLDEIAPELRQIKIPHALSFGKFERQELIRIAKLLEDATSVFGDLRQPSKQPWRGIGTVNISSFDADSIATDVGDTAKAIAEYQIAAETLKRHLQWQASFETPEELDRRLHEATDIAPLTPDPDVIPALAKMQDPHLRRQIEKIAGIVDRIQDTKSIIAASDDPGIAAHQSSELLQVVALAAACDSANSNADQIDKIIASLQKQIATDAAAIAQLERLSGIIPVDHLKSSAAIKALLDATSHEPPPADYRDLLPPEHARETTISRLKQAKFLADALRQVTKALGEDVDLQAIPAQPSLRIAVRHLREAGFFDRMKAPFKEARSLGCRIDPGLSKATPADIADRLDQALAWRDAKALFDEYLDQNQAIKAIVPNHKVSFDGLMAAADWIISVRRAIPVDLPGAGELFTAIVKANDAGHDALKAFRDVHGKIMVAMIEDSPANLDEVQLVRDRKIAKLQLLKRALDLLGWTGARDIAKLEPIAAAIDILQQGRTDLKAEDSGVQMVAKIWTGEDTQPDLLLRLVTSADSLAAWPLPGPAIERIFASSDPIGEITMIKTMLANVKTAGRAALDRVEALTQRLTLSVADWGNATIIYQLDFNYFKTRAEAACQHPELLSMQCALLTAEQEALLSPLGEIMLAWQKADLSYDRLPDIVWPIWHRCAAEELISQDPTLQNHVGKAHETIRAQFRQLDNEILSLNREMLAERLYHRRAPAGNRVGSRLTWTEGALIDHQCSLERPSLHLRRFFTQAPIGTKAYKPCFMMSPMSVARYLQPGKHTFDLLVIDEASQMRPQDALGAILRATQTIVVGDNKQLPPSSFFDRQSAAATLPGVNPDIIEQSVLELSMRAWRRRRKLNWHYRSRHQRLIQFSNFEFYDSQLIVFPSDRENGKDIGVELVEVFGDYASSLNEREALEVTERAMQFMEDHPDRSLGIVAVNAEQAERIKLLIMEATKTSPAAQAYQERWKPEIEDFFTKGLERVQGDERDTIFISTVYGKSPEGAFNQHFGPINSAGGHRRLNVLFTRAKQQMVIFTSMDPDWIHFSAATHEGVGVLQRFLRYAKTGNLSAPITISAAAAPDSMFESWFLDRLKRHGYDAVPQVGVKGYRIDIGIRHPDLPGRFILGLECDGATYHSAKSARDRDRLRQMVLENLGWRIHRIWSTDWFRNSEREFQTLLDLIETLRRGDREDVVEAERLRESASAAADDGLDEFLPPAIAEDEDKAENPNQHAG